MSDRIKKIIKVSFLSLLALFIVIVSVLGAVERAESGGSDCSSKFIERLSGKVYVFTDPDTGVQYLMYTVNGGITPRLDCTGKSMVSPVGVIYDEKN